MSHADDQDYDHPIEQHTPEEGFDRTEPNSHAIWGFTVGSVAVLILVIFAVQGYFEQIYKDAVYQRVLSAPSEQLQDVRNRDAWNLSHYMYGDLDKTSKRVRVPIEKAMQMLAEEAAAGKTFYPGKPTVPKKEEPATPVAAAPANPAPKP
jgi:hypothetical protein